jgi:hypothetical protein
MAKGDKEDIRNAKRSAGKNVKGQEMRFGNSFATKLNKNAKADVKSGKLTNQPKFTSSKVKVSKTNSATKPSMPVKQGVKNKVKAQGAKAMSAPTSGYGKSTRPRGK